MGTLGIIFLIASISYSQLKELSIIASFFDYFQGGQLGLPTLALFGILLIAFWRHGRLHPFWAVALGLSYMVSIITTAVIIGFNPGFHTDKLTDSTLFLLWAAYFVLHIVWFFLLALEPAVPSVQEVGQAQEDRVNKIKMGASSRAK